jgi:hypothetical protein
MGELLMSEVWMVEMGPKAASMKKKGNYIDDSHKKTGGLHGNF